jgi:hypothetical protein
MTEVKEHSNQNVINIEYHNSTVTCGINKFNSQINTMHQKPQFDKAIQTQKSIEIDVVPGFLSMIPFP